MIFERTIIVARTNLFNAFEVLATGSGCDVFVWQHRNCVTGFVTNLCPRMPISALVMLPGMLVKHWPVEVFTVLPSEAVGSM